MNAFDRLSRIELDEAAAFLHHHFTFINTIDVVVQVGSGQSPDEILDEEWDRASLQRMPHVPAMDSLAKHKLSISWGCVGDAKVLVYGGRYHYYEGYGIVPCILPVWAAAECGARTFLFTNAAGGIRDDLEPGSIMLLDDHINNLGVSPLAGHSHLVNTPYVDMSAVYDADLRSGLQTAAEGEEIAMSSGVYMANTGPHFETPAEVRMARNCGVDAVGMSTVLEATTAKALGARVAAVSIITNRAAGCGADSISHEDNVDAGRAASANLTRVIRRWLGA
jgi:purine-nucleoside phosphorylase